MFVLMTAMGLPLSPGLPRRSSERRRAWPHPSCGSAQQGEFKKLRPVSLTPRFIGVSGVAGVSQPFPRVSTALPTRFERS